MQEQLEIANATGIGMRLNIAGPGARSYAFVIDWHIRILLVIAWFSVASLLVVGGITVPESGEDVFAAYLFLVIVPVSVIYFLYHPILEIVLKGRTPGKRIAGVRVVSLEGEPPGVLAHLIRNVLRLIDSLPAGYMIGLASCVLTKKAVRIGDMAAGTLLIYESDARGDSLSTVPVSPLAIQRFGLAKAELAQDLLDRWSDLDSRERMGLAWRLIPALDERVQPATDDAALRDQLHRLMQGEDPQ